ncbi:MAG TPA: DNA primase [Micromonosporaceae bacterium]
MPRQSSHRHDADEPTRIDESETDAASDDGADETARSAADVSLWQDTRIDPIEIALPSGVGFTLRAYRLSTEVTPTDISERDEDDVFTRHRAVVESEEDEDEEFPDADVEAAEEALRRDGADLSDADDDAAEEAVEDDEEPVAEEVPVFLSHRGRLLLFKSPESLVRFVRSEAPHDLAQLDTWHELVERITAADVVALEEDSYELDLVVENLRGGHDVWDPPLLIKAGELARDLGYALRLPSVLDMLAPGSSLDDLDEALRASVDGGIGGFLARRRLKKIGAQTASLGWRTIIGKISAAVDWRD